MDWRRDPNPLLFLIFLFFLFSFFFLLFVEQRMDGTLIQTHPAPLVGLGGGGRHRPWTTMVKPQSPVNPSTTNSTLSHAAAVNYQMELPQWDIGCRSAYLLQHSLTANQLRAANQRSRTLEPDSVAS